MLHALTAPLRCPVAMILPKKSQSLPSLMTQHVMSLDGREYDATWEARSVPFSDHRKMLPAWHVTISPCIKITACVDVLQLRMSLWYAAPILANCT